MFHIPQTQHKVQPQESLWTLAWFRLGHPHVMGVVRTIGKYGGFLKWGYPKMDGLQGKILLK